jgi:hypothetical protein
MQLLARVHGVRERGIVFRGDGSPEPIIMCDASFKVDPYTWTQWPGAKLEITGSVIMM